jgi:uncharacterized protein YqgV (UPF0045/DUF77 family)
VDSYAAAMTRVKVEFTIEPFVDGALGPHVRAAVDAARSFDDAVEVGPFGSTVEVSGIDAPVLVHDVIRAAIANGASRVAVQVEMIEAVGE